ILPSSLNGCEKNVLFIDTFICFNIFKFTEKLSKCIKFILKELEQGKQISINIKEVVRSSLKRLQINTPTTFNQFISALSYVELGFYTRNLIIIDNLSKILMNHDVALCHLICTENKTKTPKNETVDIKKKCFDTFTTCCLYPTTTQIKQVLILLLRIVKNKKVILYTSHYSLIQKCSLNSNEIYTLNIDT
ncbi:hypothetical protein A3Q56_07894, partial [Intoshia linei]